MIATSAAGATVESTPTVASSPMLDPSCDPPDDYTDTVAFANDGTVFVGLSACGEIWRFAPGARGNVAPVGVLTTWKTKKFEIDALGTSGSHLLVAGFSSIAVFAENAVGDAAPLRFIGDGKDDTESKNPLGVSDGAQLGVFARDDGGIFVLHSQPLHGAGGGGSGPFVVPFAPGAHGDATALHLFDPSSDYPKPDSTVAIALGAAGILYVLDGYGNILASGADWSGPYHAIAHFASGERFTSFAIDVRGRFIAGGGSSIHVIAGALSGAPRETIIRGAKTTLRASATNGRVGILALGTDATGSLHVFECDEDNRGRILTFAADAVGNVAPSSVLAGPRTHLRC